MTPEQKAVIKAAREMVRDSTDRGPVEEAVHALERAEAARKNTLDELAAEIRSRSVRAANVFARNVQASLRGHGILSYGWPVIRTPQDFADMSAEDVLDTYKAGPHVWTTWLDALDELGIVPSWAFEVRRNIEIRKEQGQ